MANRKNLSIAILLLLSIVFTGIVGYMLIESYDFVEALYMTFITISTVGFREVRELSTGGKIFTIFLIITSLGTVAYSFSVIATRMIEGEFQYYIRGQIKKSGIRKMKNHIIVCGYGRNGKQAAAELTAHKIPFVVVENNRENFDKVVNNSILFIEGDATEDKILQQAGVANAKALITSLPNDADNLFVALTARSINPSLNIISRASNESTESKMRIAGVNNVVMPEKVGGEHMASLVIQPDIVEFLDHISIHGKDETNLEEITCSNISENFLNHTIRDMEIRIKTGANIIGFKDPDGKFIINPSAETKLIANSKLFVLGKPEQITKMKEILRG